MKISEQFCVFKDLFHLIWLNIFVYSELKNILFGNQFCCVYIIVDFGRMCVFTP